MAITILQKLTEFTELQIFKYFFSKKTLNLKRGT